MPVEPDVKRAVSFIDGQYVHRLAGDAFGAGRSRANGGVRFCSGIPSTDRSPMGRGNWTRRLTEMQRSGIAAPSRPLRNRVETVHLPDGPVHEIPVKRKKVADPRLGLYAVRRARNGELDVAIPFSQDRDLAEVAREVRANSRSARRWLQGFPACPHGRRGTSGHGIDLTDWYSMEREFRDSCPGPEDYRPPRWRRHRDVSAGRDRAGTQFGWRFGTQRGMDMCRIVDGLEAEIEPGRLIP